MVATIVLTLLPNTHPNTQHHIDKLMHFGAYFIMSIIPAMICRKPALVFIAVLLCIVGIGTEIGQLFVPERSGTLGDVAANLSGVLVGTLCGVFYQNKYVDDSA